MHPRLFLGIRVTPDQLPLFQTSNLIKTYHEEMIYLGYSLPPRILFQELVNLEIRLIQEFTTYSEERNKKRPVLFSEVWLG